MKVLVTGGAGFIASHIVDQLIELGHQVVIFDNFSTGNSEYINPKAKVYTMDILDHQLVEFFVKESAEVIIHHAAQIDIQHSIKNPIKDANININGTINVLEASIKAGVRKIIYASSAAVYGVPSYLPIDESHLIKPISYYGISKHTPEHYIEVYANLYDLDYTILRYANVFGTRQDHRGEGGVISVFIDNLLNGRTPVIFGNGQQTRDFIYVKDVVRANIYALNKGFRNIYNVSSNKQTTIKELLYRVSDICGKPFSVSYLPARGGEIVDSCLENNKALRELNWKPIYTLEDGLKETYEYYRGNFHK